MFQKEKVLALILSIFKKSYFPGIILAGFLILSGCTSKSSHKKAATVSDAMTKELESAAKKAIDFNYGPTLNVKEGAPYVDKTQAYGLSDLQAVSFNAIDLNLDGTTDLVILPTYYSRPKFYLNDPVSHRFSEWKHDPLPGDFKASYLFFYDINRDRIPDLVSGVLNQRSEVSKIPLRLYLGKIKDGNLTFQEQKDAFKLPAEPTSSLTFLDYDLDGWIDIFVANWFEQVKDQHIPVADRLLRNNKGKFEEVTNLLTHEATKLPTELFPPNAMPTYGSSSCDIDQNGYPDIMTVSSSGHKNKLWMNLKETQTSERYFEDIGPVTNYASDPNGSLIPTGGGRNFFSACTDYNDDGLMDIFLGDLSHAYDNDSVDKSSILTGSRETYPPYFLRTEYVSDAMSESWNQGDRRGVWLDYNLDGKIDLIVDNSGFPPYSRLVMFEQDETRAFYNVGAQLGIDIVNPQGTIIMDVNQDGKPDIITAQNNIRRAEIKPRVFVFENQMSMVGKRSVKVHVQGLQSNSEALGAMVMLYTQTKTKKIVQRRWVEYSQGGLPSQNESGIQFGVGEGVEVVGIKVRWPFVKKEGLRTGHVVEKLYSLKDYPEKDFSEYTICEDGKVLIGKISCRF
jgi:hypothetical protein